VKTTHPRGIGSHYLTYILNKILGLRDCKIPKVVFTLIPTWPRNSTATSSREGIGLVDQYNVIEGIFTGSEITEVQ
jgi:hypothetical protein